MSAYASRRAGIDVNSGQRVAAGVRYADHHDHPEGTSPYYLEFTRLREQLIAAAGKDENNNNFAEMLAIYVLKSLELYRKANFEMHADVLVRDILFELADEFPNIHILRKNCDPLDWQGPDLFKFVDHYCATLEEQLKAARKEYGFAINCNRLFKVGFVALGAVAAILTVASIITPAIASSVITVGLTKLATTIGISLTAAQFASLANLALTTVAAVAGVATTYAINNVLVDKIQRLTAKRMLCQYGNGQENFFGSKIMNNSSYCNKISQEERSLNQSWQRKYL
ncbi:hypothetical protein [Rickettsiales endosymbiont of Stachyamoeba lipophora]|uniref:hypothetical protein n=1 Tax=Rickettsiales endosymbiont of Stachyamoeba lipophora TaxID=2486578 RepID=UPI000F64E8E2|nr:hypothetical protein [Rickettsiales endosymbiont of Stachyamoeba lipophora]AZL15049.1 hypothetical protein EF513_00505 [Rickettsiales endosymbiont of Stachyamoeba lipophora]